jgi:hypothetical protein
MRRRDFFACLERTTRAHLPQPVSAFRTRRFANLLKVFFDDERVHYEVWVDSRRGHVEVGLHLETGAALTALYLSALDARIIELKGVLGYAAELGRWTQSWGHLYEVWPLDDPEHTSCDFIAERLALYVTTLQPVIEEIRSFHRLVLA